MLLFHYAPVGLWESVVCWFGIGVIENTEQEPRVVEVNLDTCFVWSVTVLMSKPCGYLIFLQDSLVSFVRLRNLSECTYAPMSVGFVSAITA